MQLAIANEAAKVTNNIYPTILMNPQFDAQKPLIVLSLNYN